MRWTSHGDQRKKFMQQDINPSYSMLIRVTYKHVNKLSDCYIAISWLWLGVQQPRLTATGLTVTGPTGLHRPSSPVPPGLYRLRSSVPLALTDHRHGFYQSRPAPITGPIGLHRPPAPVFTGHRHQSHRPSPISVTGLISLHWSPSPANISVSLRYWKYRHCWYCFWLIWLFLLTDPLLVTC